MITTTINEELEQIRMSNKGVLKPQQVVDYARDKDSALHSRFEWNNSKAAAAHRLTQAMKIIRVSVIILHGQTKPVRAYVSLMADRGESGDGYRAIVDVLADDQLCTDLLIEAKAEMKVFRERFKSLSALAAVFNAMDKVA
jgi:hypothetical protein